MDIFLAAPHYVQLHAIAALVALGTGPIALYRKRRDIWHKAIGYVWIIAMVSVAFSSFWISSFGVIGPFSPIHLLSIWTLYVVVRAVQFARQGKIVAHLRMLKSLYWGGLWVAFALNFLPDRMTNRIVFGTQEAQIGAILAILIFASAVLFGPYFQRFGRRLSAS